MAAAVALALFIALVPGSLGQLLRLGLQQLVEGLFYAASYQLFDLTLDYFLVKLYNLFGHGLLSPFRMVGVTTSFYQVLQTMSLFVFAKLIVPYQALQRDYADLWGPLSDLLKKLSAVVEM